MKDSDVKITISKDEMKASLELAQPEEGEEYNYSEVEKAIKARKVTFGVDYDLVSKMVKDKIYNCSYIIASGKEKKDGVDGYLEYKFTTEFDKKPQVNEDGSVNYHKLHLIEIVEKDQEIVEVHDPIACENGMTVTGKIILAKAGKAVSLLQGRGFRQLPDKHHYVADLCGKIEKVNEKVFISEIYEINADVDMKTGNIDFRGDVVIHGNVTSGMSVNATGSVTVDGTVEAATIKAGKDIIIRGGFIGGYKGMIETDSNLLVKFMEYGTVRAAGDINTDSILNCHVTCYSHIFMEGKHANIIGGYVYAACGIEVYSLGSDKGAETKIVVGIEKMHLQQIISFRTNISDEKELLNKIDVALEQLEKIAQAQKMDSSKDPKRLALLRSKIKTQSDLKKNQMDLAKLENLKERAKDAKVVVIRNVFPRVSVTIGTEKASVKELISTVEFKLHNEKIGIFSMKSAEH